jgi:hypothetical protein
LYWCHHYKQQRLASGATFPVGTTIIHSGNEDTAGLQTLVFTVANDQIKITMTGLPSIYW